MNACQKAFELLKKAVMKSSVLTHFNLTQVIILKCDSSDNISEGVLSHYRDNDLLHSVAFFSKNLIPAKCNYEIYDKELLTIIHCLEN